MQALYQSKKGDVNTKEGWEKWYTDTFNYCVKAHPEGRYPITRDVFGKVAKLLQLQEIDV